MGFLVCFGHFCVTSGKWLEIGEHMLNGTHLSEGREGGETLETNQLQSEFRALTSCNNQKNGNVISLYFLAQVLILREGQVSLLIPPISYYPHLLG